MGRKLDWRSVRLHRGYEDFTTSGSNSVQQALTTAQRDAISVDELREGDRIWNITTQTLQVWNGTMWVDIGGGGGGGHLGVDGETGSLPDFEDHDSYNTSWMWKYQLFTPTQTVPLTPDPIVVDGLGPGWFGNLFGPSGHTPAYVSAMGDCIINPSNGDIDPLGLDPVDAEDFMDSGVARNIQVPAPAGNVDWCPQYLMVKGLSLNTDPSTHMEAYNVVVGFASLPFQGLYSAFEDGFNTGVFFVAANGLELASLGITPLNFTDDPFETRWYVCVATAGFIFAKETVHLNNSVLHKFYVEWHIDHADFYVDDVLAETITEAQATDGSDTAWPKTGLYYPTVGVSNTTTPNYEYLNMAVGGYVGCVSGDKGHHISVPEKDDIGELVSYDNIAMRWAVKPSSGGIGTMDGFGEFTPAVPPLPTWTINALIGRHILIGGLSYVITSNTAVTVTVGAPPAPGPGLVWQWPFEVGDLCTIIAGSPASGTISGTDAYQVVVYPEFRLPWIHGSNYTPDSPP